MKKDTLKFCGIITIVAISLFTIDRLVGVVGEKLTSIYPPSSDFGRIHYGLFDTENEAIIVGSSRGKMHYDPNILADSLGLDFYNIGNNSYRVNMVCCLVNTILDRYSPKLILWEISSTDWLITYEEPFEEYYPYYNRLPYVKQMYDEQKPNWNDRLKMKSNLYCYNSMFGKMFHAYSSQKKNENRGFRNTITVSHMKEVKNLYTEKKDTSTNFGNNSAKVRRILDRAKEKNVQIVFTLSPRAFIPKTATEPAYREFLKIVEEYDVPFLNNEFHPYFLDHLELFYDKWHLTLEGSEIYTHIIVQQLREHNIRVLEGDKL